MSATIVNFTDRVRSAASSASRPARVPAWRAGERFVCPHCGKDPHHVQRGFSAFMDPETSRRILNLTAEYGFSDTKCTACGRWIRWERQQTETERALELVERLGDERPEAIAPLLGWLELLLGDDEEKGGA